MTRTKRGDVCAYVVVVVVMLVCSWFADGRLDWLERWENGVLVISLFGSFVN